MGSESHFTNSSARQVGGLLDISALTLQVSRHALLGSRLLLKAGAQPAWEELNTGVLCWKGRSGAGTFLTYTPVRGHIGTFTHFKARALGFPSAI